MSKPSSDLQVHPVYSCQTADGTVIAVNWTYLTDLVLEGRPVHDAGGVHLVVSDEDGTKAATPDPEMALEIAHAIEEAAHLAIAARGCGTTPDTVPAEWTGEGPV